MSNYENDADLATSLLGMSGLKLNMSPLPRKNMTTREILEHRLANYNDDMELKTPYSDPEIEFDGNDVYVRRNGTEFESFPAMAGKPGYQNRSSMSVSDRGPTPEGLYYADPKKLQERKSRLSRLKEAILDTDMPLADKAAYVFEKGTYRWQDEKKKPSWGNYRVPLEPAEDTETFGRHSMYIHGGDELGSAGCIDLGPNMDRLAPYIRSSRQPVRVRVKYKADDFER